MSHPCNDGEHPEQCDAGSARLSPKVSLITRLGVLRPNAVRLDHLYQHRCFLIPRFALYYSASFSPDAAEF